ncbi:type II secretion system GspH family protein [Methylovorus menthalis]|uniref:type II secretion system protein n=1 Tax=Methylovorus menthalis TaxID=1002227 RepID=UPI001E41C1A1|nr:type II secretion system protein [Methylovorus menthalis]MCB4810616.1 type II secretion system GspH family protein [Methylovorus menthalis]
MMSYPTTSRGFSLIELSIVLVIVGLVIAGMLVPLSAQIDQKNYNETQKAMVELRDGLIGYASSNGYLPCPDTTGDGVEDRDTGTGACLADPAEGNLPWANLGMGKQDAWGQKYQYRVTNGFANSVTKFTLSTGPSMTITDTSGVTLALRVPAVIVSKGKSGAGAGVNEQENSDKDDSFVSDVPSAVAGNEFDDIVVWVPSTLLFNRMLTAGKLP